MGTSLTIGIKHYPMPHKKPFKEKIKSFHPIPIIVDRPMPILDSLHACNQDDHVFYMRPALVASDPDDLSVLEIGRSAIGTVHVDAAQVSLNICDHRNIHHNDRQSKWWM